MTDNETLMGTSRLEAFSDGVLAVIITIMVLGLRTPEHTNVGALHPLIPQFVAYVLSFIMIATYWNNHHHLLHVTEHIDPRIMWANMNLLFWLSLVPFFTSWAGKNYKEAWPTALYGVVLLGAAFSYFLLQKAIVAGSGENSQLAAKLGGDAKGKLSLLMYAAAIPLAFATHWIADALYVLVAFLWFIPDRRLK